MPFDSRWSFRDCGWCGLRDGQFNVLHPQLAANSPGRSSRFYALLACPRCAGLVVLEHGGDGVTMPPETLLPRDEAAVDVQALPDDVKRYYKDAVRVLDAGVPDAAAVQLRKALEAAAAHRGVDKGTLVQRIEKLIAQGDVTKEFGRVLDHVRKVGNVGAHAGDETVDEAEARRALRFTRAILRNLFEVPAELAALDAAAR